MDPGADWRLPGFDDSSWAQANGPFGSGEAFHFDSELNAEAATVYFRQSISVTRPDLVDLSVSLETNLGAVFYLNGVEVGRHRMPEGPVNHETLALDVPAEGLALWVSGDGPMETREQDGRTFVTKWVDQSGHGRDLEQSVAARQPELFASGLNGEPALRFDGSTRRMATAGFATGMK